jgi:hypothetical protein
MNFSEVRERTVRNVCATNTPRLVFSGALNMIDSDHWNGAFSGFHFQTELFLKRGEK